MSKKCIECDSTDLAKRGDGFRNRCKKCYNTYQRGQYLKSRELYLPTRRKLYKKHSTKRRAESKIRKSENRERYSLLEWFRKKGIKADDLPKGSLDELTKMKIALNESKKAVKDKSTK